VRATPTTHTSRGSRPSGAPLAPVLAGGAMELLLPLLLLRVC
jgi:hypothetical protein